MQKQIVRIINIIVGTAIGVFFGHAIYRYLDYLNQPELYRIQSAPWYTGILVNGFFVILLIAAAVIIKLILKLKITRR